jgi:hypothetical protein
MLDWLLSYGTLGLGALFSVGALYKESEEYVAKKSGRPLLLLMYFSTLLILIGGIVKTHQTRVQSEADKQQAAKDRKQLEDDRGQAKQERAINDAKLNDAKDRLQGLQDKVDKLQTKSETQELSKQLADVKHDLAEAESKLQQPKAHLVATFSTTDYEKLPVHETTGERVPEGIKFNFGVFNDSDVAGVRGSVVLKLCAGCTSGGEPDGFTKPRWSPDDERYKDFARVQEHQVSQDLRATVIPPIAATAFQVGVMVKCEDCVPSKWDVLTIKIPAIVPPDFKATPKKSKTA